MTVVTEQCVVPYSVKNVHDTVIAVSQYPDFLPGCQHVRLIVQNQDNLIADTTISGLVFRTQMRWGCEEGNHTIFFDNPYITGVWNLSPCTADHDCKTIHLTNISLRMIIQPGFFAPILRMALPAVLPIMQKAFQQRLNDLY